MRPIRRVFLFLACIVTAGVAAQDSPAAAVPSDTLIFLQLDRTVAQQLVASFTMPPIAGMAGAPAGHRFGMVAQILETDPRKLDRAAPHLNHIAIAFPEEDPDDPVVILTFDDEEWPALLMADADKDPETGAMTTTVGDPWFGVNGRHLLVANSTDVAKVAAGDFQKLGNRRDFSRTTRAAGDSPAWAWVDVPGLLGSIREAQGHTDDEFEVFAYLSGLEDATDAVFFLDAEDNAVTLKGRMNLKENARGVAALMPEGPAATASMVPADAAAAVAAHWGDPEKFMDGLVAALRDAAMVCDPDMDFDAWLRDDFEDEVGISTDELARQLGSGFVAYMQPRGPYNMIGRADWVAALAVRRPAEFRQTWERWMDEDRHGAPPAVQQVGGMDVSQWPMAPVFYAVNEPALVVAGSAKAVHRRFQWLGEARRETFQADAPKGAVALQIRLQDILQGWPREQQPDLPLLDDPADRAERLDDEQIAAGVFLGVASMLLEDTVLRAALAREGRTVSLEARLTGLPELSSPALPLLMMAPVMGFAQASRQVRHHRPVEVRAERDRPEPRRELP